MAEREESTGPMATAAGPQTVAEPSEGASRAAAVATSGWLERNLPLSLDAYEKAALERALVETWGDASHAARLLGIGRSTFYRKAGKHGINLGEIRGPASEPLGATRPEREEREPASDPSGVGAPKTLG
jgi:DNA-binding NtrC family response regulator